MGLIRNADDLGKSESVNSAIFTCFEKDYIDRATLMVNMPYAEEAVMMANKLGLTEKIGIHLNLTEGIPLSEPIKNNPLFCDNSGRFTAAFRQSLKYRLYMDSLSKQDIYIELKAQFERYIELGLTLFHVDSHHHVHTDYPIFSVLKKLSAEYDYSSARLSRNLYRRGNLFNRIYKKWYNVSLKKYASHTSDYFGSSADYKEYISGIDKDKFISGFETEIMLHPLYDEKGILMDTDVPMETVQTYFR